MRLTGASDDEMLTEAWAYLNREEAFLLYMSLGFYFEAESDPGWHHHVGGGPGGAELTIAIEH